MIPVPAVAARNTRNAAWAKITFFHRYPTSDYDNVARICERLAWAGAEAVLQEFVKPIRQQPDGPGYSLSAHWFYFGMPTATAYCPLKQPLAKPTYASKNHSAFLSISTVTFGPSNTKFIFSVPR